MLLCTAAAPAAGQDSGLHWAYAAFFGIGRYELDGQTETTVLGFTPGWTWRQPALDDSGQRSIGYRFRFPFAIGSTDFESFDQIDEVTLQSFDNFSLVPGIDVEIRVTPRWRIKPLGYIGMGFAPGGVRAGIFRLGARSEFVLTSGRTRVALFNGVERVGYSENGGTSDAVNQLQTGLDFSRPLANTRINEVPVTLNWHLMYTRFPDSIGIDVRTVASAAEQIDGEWEAGFAFGRQNARLQYRRLRFDRVGIVYRFAPGGDFSGVGIVFKSLFDR